MRAPLLAAAALLAGVVPPPPAASVPGADGASAVREIDGRIARDTGISGAVRVTGDVLVLPGATLRLAPGTVVTVAKGDSTKVDPEFFLGGPEIVVRGRLEARGASFAFEGRTGGIVVDGGRADLSGARVSGAETGVSVLRGGAVASREPLAVSDCRVGVAFGPGAAAWEGDAPVTLSGNAVGWVRFPGAPAPTAAFRPSGNEEADAVAWEGYRPRGGDEDGPAPAPGPGALRLTDTFLDRDRTLSGDVVVDGVLRVAPGTILTVAPGTRLFFTFRDTDGDGVGENGLFLQGNLRARGTEAAPVEFLPDGGAGAARWDAVNFMASDAGENVLEHVRISGAYRGVHAHFSRLTGRDLRISRCYRGIQFQESEVHVDGLSIEGCTSALRCRDSDVRIGGMRVRDTVSGANFFRSRVDLASCDIARPGWYALRFRDSRATLSGASVGASYVGISVQDGTLAAASVTVSEAGLAGFSLLSGDVRMDNCRVLGSRVDAIGATSATVAVSGGELSAYGRHAVNLGGPASVTLRGVDYRRRGGTADFFRDGAREPGRGGVRVE